MWYKFFISFCVVLLNTCWRLRSHTPVSSTLRLSCSELVTGWTDATGMESVTSFETVSWTERWDLCWDEMGWAAWTGSVKRVGVSDLHVSGSFLTVCSGGFWSSSTSFRLDLWRVGDDEVAASSELGCVDAGDDEVVDEVDVRSSWGVILFDRFRDCCPRVSLSSFFDRKSKPSTESTRCKLAIWEGV